MPSTGLHAHLACLWEATARKPGNVHPAAAFPDLTYLDFAHSAAAVAPVFDVALTQSVGRTILDAIRATRRVAVTNTNLGIVLLLAPLAATPPARDLRPGLARTLDALTADDARLAYEAIRLANPGGLGRAPEQDVRDAPTAPLREVMALAADRDLVARQYATNFALVLDEALPALLHGLDAAGCLEGAILACYLHLLARHPDTLIVRKHGPAVAEEVRRRAAQVGAEVWDAARPHAPAGPRGLSSFDAWLRAGRLNPGATADLVAATLFAALHAGEVLLPLERPWTLDLPLPTC